MRIDLSRLSLARATAMVGACAVLTLTACSDDSTGASRTGVQSTASAGPLSAPATPDPNGTWETKAPLPFARAGMATGVIGGLMYAVAGGAFGTDPALQVYDPIANGWTVRASMPTNRGGLGGVIDGKFYAVGGCINSDCRIGVTNVLEMYDPATNSWTTRTPMPAPRATMAGGVIGGKLYVAGGFADCPGCVATTTLQVYDPATNTWTIKAPMPSPRSHTAGGVIDGKLYVVGGQRIDFEGGPITLPAALLVYDPALDVWTTRAPMPTPRSILGVAALNGFLYAIGGDHNSPTVNTVEAYNPSTDVWTTVASMPTARGFIDPQVINGVLYVAGGLGSGGLVDVLEAFTPAAAADLTPPAFGTLPDITTNATAPAGAVVSYTAPASDNVGVTSQSCVPASGSTFPIGTTTVQCAASDAAGNTGHASFTITVIGAAAQMTDLRGTVEGFGFQQGSETSLKAKLDAALSALAAGNVSAACGQLGAMINQINAQTGNKISAPAAATLIAEINRIRGAIGC